MKYFILDSKEEFLDADGNRHKIGDEEFENADKVNIKQSVSFCKRSGDVELSTSYILIFEDGSIFDEHEGSFTPVRIIVEM